MSPDTIANAGHSTREAEIAAARAVPEQIHAAWIHNDAQGFADLYTRDATMILSGDRYLRGQDAILSEVKASFAGPHRGTSLLQNVIDARVLSGDVAVLITEGGVLAPGETVPAPEREIRATWVLSKQDGRWLIAAYQNTRNADGRLPGA